MTKAQQAERQDAIAKLRDWIKPGDTVYTILESVSRSGMSRVIRIVVPIVRARCSACRQYEPRLTCADTANGAHLMAPHVDFLHPNYSVSIAMGLRLKTGARDGVMVHGARMDMGFHLVYELSHVLYADGKPLEQRWL